MIPPKLAHNLEPHSAKHLELHPFWGTYLSSAILQMPNFLLGVLFCSHVIMYLLLNSHNSFIGKMLVLENYYQNISIRYKIYR
jgi:hypothetical protein